MSDWTWVTEQVNAPRVRYGMFESAAAGRQVSYHIYVPEAYDAEPARRFPVLYWLHGSGGGIPGIRPLAAYFDAAIREGKIPPMLIAFPNGLDLSLWVNSKDGSVPMETVVMEEFIPHIDATYRTIASREGRLVEGFSMGGYGAARLGLIYSDVFGAASILAGGPLQQEFTYTPRVGNRSREWVLATIFGGDHTYFEAISPWGLAAEHAEAVRGRLPMRVVIGAQDEMVEVNRKFDLRLTQVGIPHTFTVVPGVGHNTMRLLRLLGEGNWEFYRSVFGALGAQEH